MKHIWGFKVLSLEVENVSSGYYEEINIINDFSLLAEESKITAIIGPNGCGKSTLLKTIYGFLKARKGSIYYGNTEITGKEPHQMLSMGIAYLPQAESNFPYLTVLENLKMGAWLLKENKEDVAKAIDRVMDTFPILRKKANDKASSLSGGQQKMLEIGRTLITNPKVFLVDEPTAGLAPIISKKIYEILKKLNEENNLTILLVDQNIRQAISISGFLYVIEFGRNKISGSKKKFLSEMKDIVKSWI